MGINIGLIGIPPRQVGNAREIETDDGEGTLLHIKRTEDSLQVQVRQYNAEAELLSEGSTWRITTTDFHISVIHHHESRWGLVSNDGVIWDIERANDGDITLVVHDPAKNELAGRMPQFSQVISGGRSKHLLNAVQMLVQALQGAAESTMVTPYVIIDAIYEAIGEERHFQK